MSNYKPRIESNNLDLTSILSTINELPDAGDAAGVCTITITGMPFYSLVYQDAGGIWQYPMAINSTPYTFETLCGSCFCAFGFQTTWGVYCDSVPDGFMISGEALMDQFALFAKVSPIPGSYTITVYEDD